VSLRLKIFNFFLKLSSIFGLSRLHQSDNLEVGFRKHAMRLDSVVGFFTRKHVHTLTTTDYDRWSWIGDKDAAKRIILYFHGSGFCANMPATFRNWADQLATLNTAAVLLVDYPLAPESPYPAALDVCLDAYRWMVEDQGVDPQHIVVGGDSAGGNLAIATLMKIREKNLPMPACAFALSPSLDLTLSGASITENANTDCISNKNLMVKLAQQYAPQGNFTDGLVSPLFGDCHGLPPIQLQVSSDELLRDDSVRFYEKFKQDIPIELVQWEGACHCHQLFGFLPEAKIARRKLQSFIEEHQ
jgi:monoterpene epsilon-lactone hydrolase